MPEVVRIDDAIAMIRLPLPLEGLPSVNTYVVHDDGEALLVDPGWSSPETERVLVEGLAALDLTPQDIDRVVATHHHWDHYTQAVTWQRKYGIPVSLGRNENPSIHAWHTLDGAFPRQVGLLEQAGANELARDIATIPVEPHEAAMDFDLPAEWLDDEQVITCGRVDLRVVATPGHTRGHVCIEAVGRGLLLTGDHVLPRITPSVAYEREPDPHSLRTYLSSLRLVADLPDLRMLPAHGDVGTEAATRAEELLEHHAERLEVIRSLVEDGRSTAHEIARSMTWTRRARRLTELEPVHGMTAVLEVVAHLAVLEIRGAVDRHREDGVEHYLTT